MLSQSAVRVCAIIERLVSVGRPDHASRGQASSFKVIRSVHLAMAGNKYNFYICLSLLGYLIVFITHTIPLGGCCSHGYGCMNIDAELTEWVCLYWV